MAQITFPKRQPRGTFALISQGSGHYFSRRVKQSIQRKPFVVLIKQESWGRVLDKWPGLSESQVEQILDEVQQLALKNITARTPILTGEARSQWFWMKPTRWERFIGNNHPAIRRLEHGWSKQPGKWFMVRATEKRVPIWVNQLAKRLWSGTVAIRGKRAA